MADPSLFPALYQRLRDIFAPFAPSLEVKEGDNVYYLESGVIGANGQPVFFGSVKVNKNYVSFHLMPVYIFPELLNEISPQLKKRMQGKSCFNFAKPDAALFEELAALAQKGFARYKHSGLLPQDKG
jgi:hypothetical protein